MKRWVAVVAMAVGFSSVAHAQEEGIPVVVQVMDAETGAPIPTAVVRHREEKDPHPVNVETGTWQNSRLYLPNGDEVVFEKGMRLEFEVSAPDYINQSITYEVRKRKNVAPVLLTRMKLDMDDENPQDVVIQFGRDKPRD